MQFDLPDAHSVLLDIIADCETIDARYVFRPPQLNIEEGSSLGG